MNNNSFSYNYRTDNTEERRATYTTPQYEDVVKKYLNYDQTQQRSTLAVNQGINTFSKSVAYAPAENTYSFSTNNPAPYGYNTVSNQTTSNQNYGGSNIYQDRLSNIQNVQIKEVQSPERYNYNSETLEDYDRVKKSKKQEVVIQKTTTQYDSNYGVSDYQPILIGQEKTYSSNLNRTPSQLVFLENPDTAMQYRSSSNVRIEYQNKTESKSIQDQNITLCNIF